MAPDQRAIVHSDGFFEHRAGRFDFPRLEPGACLRGELRDANNLRSWNLSGTSFPLRGIQLFFARVNATCHRNENE